jgi:hypothetical protein
MADRSDDKRVVGVYSDEASAQEAARAAEQAGGKNVRVGTHEDEVAALMGEMREETGEAWVGPSVGPLTKEMARSVPRWTVVCALIGALVTLAINFIGGGNLDVGARLVIAACIGAVAGGTIGFLIGGGFFEPRRKASSDLAAEEGVVVGAEEVDATDRALAEHDPIRVDVVDAEGPEETVITEDQTGTTEDQTGTTGERTGTTGDRQGR